MSPKNRKRVPSFPVSIENDPDHHLTGPLMPQTPLGSLTPQRSASPVPARKPISPWLRWAIYPASALKVLLIPPILYLNWELLAPLLANFLQPLLKNYVSPYPNNIPNPFAALFLIQNHVPTSSLEDPRYAKSYADLLFIAYHIVFFSFVRQIITVNICRPIARYFGLKKEAKLDRFGEQGYAVVYFGVMGAWGYRIMGQLPTFWYRTEHFWIGYPHWDMKPELKRYYLMEMSYWAQQLLVLVLKLEKPRKDYNELVAHHLVTIWLVGWSYFINLTLIGNAVYMSMDLPDAVFAFSKILNYIQYDRAKTVSFVFFIGVWTYFRHILNLYILWSVWFEYDTFLDQPPHWQWDKGNYLVDWMKYQVFIPLALLQLLNLFWYYLIMRVLYRGIVSSTIDDVRSDDEGDDEKED